MANHKSALKRHRQSLTRSVRNRGYRTNIKTVTKKVYSAVEAKDADQSQQALQHAIQTISKVASKGVIHKRAASRKISGLTKRVNALTSPRA